MQVTVLYKHEYGYLGANFLNHFSSYCAETFAFREFL